MLGDVGKTDWIVCRSSAALEPKMGRWCPSQSGVRSRRETASEDVELGRAHAQGPTNPGWLSEAMTEPLSRVELDYESCCVFLGRARRPSFACQRHCFRRDCSRMICGEKRGGCSRITSQPDLDD